MSESSGTERYSKDAILKDVVNILEETSSEFEMESGSSIGLETMLGADLELKSINLVQHMLALQKVYGRQDFPFQDLFMPDEDVVVSDLSVSDVVEFLYKHLNS